MDINSWYQIVSTYHLSAFFIISLALEYLSTIIEVKVPSIHLFNASILPALIELLSKTMTYYRFVVGGVIASIVGYIIGTVCDIHSFSEFQMTVIQLLTMIFSICVMILFSAVSIPALVYSFIALRVLPKMQEYYIVSYIAALAFCAASVYAYHSIVLQLQSMNINLYAL